MIANSNISVTNLKKRVSPSLFDSLWWTCPNGLQVQRGLIDRADLVEFRWHDSPSPLFVLHELGTDSFVWPETAEETKFWVPEPEIEWIIPNSSSQSGPYWDGMAFSKAISFYQPQREKGLHRQFAKVAKEPDSIAQFAEKYGFLGTETRVLEFESGEVTLGEPIELWIAEISRADFLIRLWDLYRSQATTEADFRELVDFDGKEISACLHEVLAAKIVHPDFNTEYEVPNLPPGVGGESSLRHAVRIYLTEAMESTIDSATYPRISIGNPGEMTYVATSLLGSIYLHLLQEMLGRADPLARCDVCGKWFQSRHASRMYCSNACKQKAYRKSKEKNSGN